MKKSFFLQLIKKIKSKVMGQNPNAGAPSPDDTKNENNFQNPIDECKEIKVENKILKNEIESLKNINHALSINCQKFVRKCVEDYEQYKIGYEACKRIIADLQNDLNERNSFE